MQFKFNGLFNTTIPNEIDVLCNFIETIREEIDNRGVKTKWSRDKDFNEYGFHVFSADKKTGLFCGLWFDLWETKGVPFCICLDWAREVSDSVKYIFFKAVEEEKTMNEVFEYDTSSTCL